MGLLRLTFLVWLLIAVNIVSAQDTVYVNAHNLILRDRPETRYNVFAILQAGCPLKVEPFEDGYKNNKSVRSRFYRVLISYGNDAGYSLHTKNDWMNGPRVIPPVSIALFATK